MAVPNWLDWAQRLESIVQTGLNYDPQPFDRDRYEMVRRIAAEMIASNKDTGPQDLIDIFAESKGHATPKIDVRAAIFRGEEILLVQEKLDNNRWTLPGGWADVGESPSVSAVREVYEETGYQVRAVKLLALFDRNRHEHPPYLYHAYKAFFRCELISGERIPDPRNVETGDVGWFTLDALPELSVARVTFRQIARFFDHLHNPDLPTDFD